MPGKGTVKATGGRATLLILSELETSNGTLIDLGQGGRGVRPSGIEH